MNTDRPDQSAPQGTGCEDPQTPTPVVAFAIAGSDPSGGAGIQADLKTFAALGVYGAAAITALTAQNTQGVSGVLPIPAEFVTRQIEAVSSDLTVRATKIGMLAGGEIITAVADCVRGGRLGVVVVDPVMIATSGHALIDPNAVAALQRDLIPLCDLLTPNLAEAARLLDRPLACDISEVIEQARALLGLGARAVLIKGGHAPSQASGEDALDVFVTASGTRIFAAPRVATTNTHGTGCTLSAAIAAGIAAGLPLETAIEEAKHYVQTGLIAARSWRLGAGSGPLDHTAGVQRVYSRPKTGEKSPRSQF